jgi:hypothetical protein
MIRPYRNWRGLAAITLQIAILGLVILVAQTAVLGAQAPVAEASTQQWTVAAALRQAAATDKVCTGPDAYDPAAGCHPEQSLLDPAARGASEPAAEEVTPSSASYARCSLSMDEIVRRILRRVPGGYSGDDAYDPAAGGTPELSVLAACASAGRP